MLDYGKEGTEGVKVVYGKLERLYFKDCIRAVVKGEDGTTHEARIPNRRVLWMGMWSHGIRPSHVPKEALTRNADDAAAQAFARLEVSKQNEILKSNTYYPCYFRIYLADNPDKDEIVCFTSRRYVVYDAEDVVGTVRKALLGYHVSVERKSNGLHAGVIRAVDKSYIHITPIVKVDLGEKNGFSPILVQPAGNFGNPYDVVFSVFTPSLKAARKKYVDEDDAAYITPQKVHHQGHQLKRIHKACREVAMDVERVDWLCEKNKKIELSEEDADRILKYYMQRPNFSKKTREKLGRWRQGSLHDFVVHIANITNDPQTPNTVRVRVLEIAGELTLMGRFHEEVYT